jgi:hypothetical protein
LGAYLGTIYRVHYLTITCANEHTFS